MGYYLGIDVGTTYTAAAVWRDGRVEMCNLGSTGAAVPSLLLLREDGELLVGEAAARRAVTEPERLVREFKRRVGDATPILVGRTPFSADALLARLLAWVVDRVVGVEGGPPDGISVCHPANWNAYKKDVLREAVNLADMPGRSAVELLSEPVAAAVHYSSLARVEPGATVLVYDLGGGTFDAAVLRKLPTGWEVLGEPFGVERLGGIDFDEAVYQHVRRVTGDVWQTLDFDDGETLAAVAQVRIECTAAKEALSTDTDAAIRVWLPGFHTVVRLTRAEFEGFIRPRLAETLTAARLALRSADVEVRDLTTVLLVGGSSRIPLVASVVGSELGVVPRTDAHPKHGTALGAAIHAATVGGARSDDAAAVAHIPPVTEPRVVPPPPPPGAATIPIAPPGAAREPDADADVARAAPPQPIGPVGVGPPFIEPPPPQRTWPGRRAAVVAAGLAMVVVAVIVVVLLDRDDPPTTSTTETTESQSTTTASTAPPTPVEVAVEAAQLWTDTGIDLREGDRVQVTATGTIFHNDVQTTGPDGFSGNPNLEGPLGSEHHAGLIGRVTESGEPFLVGSTVDFTADTDGRLYLGINDDGVENNRGSFQASVTVTSG